MDAEITSTPIPTGELADLIDKANKVYFENFNGDVWFGRCIFLSFYCDRGTCTFCFRSTQKHHIKHPSKARRSLKSVIAEALLIQGLGWRIEFLTGGYGIAGDDELIRYAKLVSQALQEPLWLNLGEMGTDLLEGFKPYVSGVVSSIETVEPKLHKQVCPDKPIEPYEVMINNSKEMGFKQGMTVIIGLGEKKEDFVLLEEFMKKHNFDRITVYALRPVGGTPFEHGPDPLDVAWWIAKIRISFPKIEIIAGSAKYRIPELSLFLKAGANAITKLPATNIFNTEHGLAVEEEVRKAGRKFVSKFTAKDVFKIADWEGMIAKLDLTDEEKKDVKETLDKYLTGMAKKGESLFVDSCEL